MVADHIVAHFEEGTPDDIFVLFAEWLKQKVGDRSFLYSYSDPEAVDLRIVVTFPSEYPA